MTEPERVDVVVVGAGIAGLVVASALVEAGRSVAVLEARDRVGGRLHSVVAASRSLDLGASWFWPGEPRVAALVARLGVEVHAQHCDGDAVYDDPSGARRLDGNPVDVPAYRYSGGAQALAEAVAAGLPVGTLRLDTTVSAVTVDGARLSVTASSGRIVADAVVLALPPALVVAAIALPDLDPQVRALAASVPVWMGSSTKAVIEYPTAFWREHGLSGSGVSHLGPLRELHDLSGPQGSPAALFGFGSGAMDPAAIVAQLVRMFGSEAAAPTQVHVQDWAVEAFTSPPGVETLGAHHLFGHPALRCPALGGRLHWASTEVGAVNPGHVEGALEAAQHVVRSVLS